VGQPDGVQFDNDFILAGMAPSSYYKDNED
jgi:hypothetical protein